MKKIKQEIFESMKNRSFGESMSDETKLNVLTWVLGKLHKGDSQEITALENEVEELREKMTVEHCPSLPECHKASQELTRLRELLVRSKNVIAVASGELRIPNQDPLIEEIDNALNHKP